MSLRKYRNFQEISTLFQKNIMPNIEQLHLDFGCGQGLSSIIEAKEKPTSKITGYDIDTKKIEEARKITKGTRLEKIFTSSKEDIEKIKFDSASAIFVYHESPNIFYEIKPFLTKKGTICVLDYNLKDASKRQFLKNFCSDNEKNILQKEDIEKCYKKHTSTNNETCTNDLTKAGFKIKIIDTSSIYFTIIATKC